MADARDGTSAGLSETELRPPERNSTGTTGGPSTGAPMVASGQSASFEVSVIAEVSGGEDGSVG